MKQSKRFAVLYVDSHFTCNIIFRILNLNCVQVKSQSEATVSNEVGKRRAAGDDES